VVVQLESINQTVEALPLSQVYIDFLNNRAKKEFMEGTTAAGKTTIGAIKFMLRVAESKRKYHMIAAADIRYS
jgi:phage terminase large subunit